MVVDGGIDVAVDGGIGWMGCGGVVGKWGSYNLRGLLGVKGKEFGSGTASSGEEADGMEDSWKRTDNRMWSIGRALEKSD